MSESAPQSESVVRQPCKHSRQPSPANHAVSSVVAAEASASANVAGTGTEPGLGGTEAPGPNEATAPLSATSATAATSLLCVGLGLGFRRRVVMAEHAFELADFGVDRVVRG